MLYLIDISLFKSHVTMAEDWMFLFFIQSGYSTIKQLENGVLGAPLPAVFPAGKKDVS
jgi:hypothetical protein